MTTHTICDLCNQRIYNGLRRIKIQQEALDHDWRKWSTTKWDVHDLCLRELVQKLERKRPAELEDA